VNGYQYNDMNTYDIINSDIVVVTEGTIKSISEEIKAINAN